MQQVEEYTGFEQGPIRPPSESGSLLIRVTRNCPWNRCTFCGLYKGEQFSIRPVEYVKRDIDQVRQQMDRLEERLTPEGAISHSDVTALMQQVESHERMAFYAALSWMRSGARSVFLQDSNSLIIKPDNLVAILEHLQQAFPENERVTSYARSHTIARITDEDMCRLAGAGLNRIHIGLESGSDQILARINKGVDKATHVKAGKKVKQAGIELSEYFMPGIGGRILSRENALESADALNQINPDFIRLRTLALPDFIDLAQEWRDGTFDKMGDRETAEEILLFLQSLANITSRIKSDHILNLFEEIDGKMPWDQGAMMTPIQRFLAMEPERQIVYQIGRRTGVFSCLADMDNAELRSRVERKCAELEVTVDNVDQVIDGLVQRFI